MEWLTNLLNKNSSKSTSNNSSSSSSSSNNTNDDKNDSNKNITSGGSIETIDNSSDNNSSDNNTIDVKNTDLDNTDLDNTHNKIEINDNDSGSNNNNNNSNDMNDDLSPHSTQSEPKTCYTWQELRRVEKRLGKIELPDEISEYVTSGRFGSISSKSEDQSNMGRRQGQGQGNRQMPVQGNGNRQMPVQGNGQGQVQRQGYGQGQQGQQGQGQQGQQGQGQYARKQGEDQWSRNRTLPQHQQQQLQQQQQQQNIQNNNNNNNNNYERRLTIAEQKLLFEQERKQILADRQKEIDDADDGGPVLQFRDETDLLLEELAGGDINQGNRSGSEVTKISFKALISSSEGDINHQHHAPLDTNGNSVVIPFSSLSASKDEVVSPPSMQTDIWSSFLDSNLTTDNIFGNSIFSNPGPTSSRRGESRLGSILKSDNKLNFDNDDTLDLTNPVLFATEALPPSPNSKANNRLNVQSLFSAARQNPNSNPESNLEHKIIKSSDVLSRLGFEGQQNSEPTAPQDASPTPTNSSSPFTFHGQDSSVKKTKKQSGGMSVASRMQLMKMGKKIESSDKSKAVDTSVTPIKSAPAPPLTLPQASESEATISNMKRINLNALFVKPNQG